MATPMALDMRTIGRIDSFDGRPESWADWSFKARAWISLLPLPGRDIDAFLTGAEITTGVIDRTLLATDVENFGVILYGVFVNCCKGRAMSLIHRVVRGNGWEVWRQLFLEFQPSEPIRHSAMLAGILTPPWEALNAIQFIEKLNAWETSIYEYVNQSGEVVSDSVKISIILRWAPKEIKDLVRGQMANIGSDFSRLRHILMAFNASGHEWDAQGNRQNLPDSGGAQPMDVGAVSISCTKCGKPGHLAANCWSKGGKGKGQGGSGGKSDSGGKGGKGAGPCWKCGKTGHRAAEC